MDHFAVNGLNLFGAAVLALMLFCYMREKRHPFYTFLFAVFCILSGVYGFLQGAWPFGVIEIIWSGVSFKRWHDMRGTA